MSHVRQSKNNVVKRPLVLNPFRPSDSEDIHTSSLGTQVRVEEPLVLVDNSNRFKYLNLEMEEQAEVNVKGLQYLDLEDHVHGHTRFSQSTNRITTLSASLPGSSDRDLAVTPHKISLGQISFTASAEDFETLKADSKEWHDFWKITKESVIFETIEL